MKTKNLIIGIFLLLCYNNYAQILQLEKKQTLTVLNIDTKGVALDKEQMGNLVRLEIDKLKLYEVMDKYDVAYMIEKHQLKIDNCYGKICLVEVGKIIESDKMLSGSVELYGETIIVSMRLIDVASETTERTQVCEYLNLPKEMQSMINVTIRKMLDLEINFDMEAKISRQFNYESAINNPDVNRLNLSGPRMGFNFYTGETMNVVMEPKHKGGFDAYPAMFMFGYQFEKQYLNEGNMQALFEFIPIVTIMDQTNFVPSFVILNGIRNNKNGWEFACGLTFFLNKTANGYYDSGDWYLSNEGPYPSTGENPNTIETRVDSRGDYKFATNFVVAFGKTFKSGKLNIPVNIFAVPSKSGMRFALSFGFNAKK